MEQFFFGLLFGVALSAAARLLGLRFADPRLTDRQRARRLAIEIGVVVLIVALAHVHWGFISEPWGAAHEWFRSYVRRPVHWFQFLLGATAGVLLRFWLAHIGAAYALTKVDTPQPVFTAPAQQGEKPADFLTRERGWMVTLAGLLLLAVLLPQIEGMIRAMSSLKLPGIEVAFRDQKEANRISIASTKREKVGVDFLQQSFLSYDAVRNRLESDERAYRKDGKWKYAEASKQYLNLYDTAIGPYLACMSALIDAGHELETMRGWTRELVVAWQAAASSEKSRAAKSLRHLVSESERLIKQSGCSPNWKRNKDTSTNIGLEAKEAPEFYLGLAGTLQVIDNGLAAIQLLSGLRGELSGHMSWHSRLALLYFDEDPTLERARAHYEAMLRIAEEQQAKAIKAVEGAGVSCPATKGAGKNAEQLCYDRDRFRKAAGNARNGLAYVLAQRGGDSGQLSRAVQLASGEVRSTLKEADSNPDSRQSYIATLDTLVYAVMASEAASPTPDAESLKCTERAFSFVTEEMKAKLSEVSEGGGRSGFRPNYVSARYLYETVNLHWNTASILVSTLEQSQGVSRCSPPQLLRLLKGSY